MTGPHDIEAAAGPGLEQDFPPPTPVEDEPPPAPATPFTEPPQGILRSLAQLLADPDTMRPPVAVIPRLAYEGRVSMVVGREKLAGKSTLITAGAAAVTAGAAFLGERTKAENVLWVSADQEHAGEIAQRARRFGADPGRFHVLWPRGTWGDFASAIDRTWPGVIVIDTLANFARHLVEDPHSSGAWPRVLLPLVETARKGCAIVILHHAKKGENGGYRDSTAIAASVDLLLELKPVAGEPARRTVEGLGRWPVSAFTLELAGDTYRLVQGTELSIDAKALAFIQANPRCSSSAVIQAVGGRAQDVRAAVTRLLRDGAVRNSGTDRRHAYAAAVEMSGNGARAADDEELPF